MNISLNVQRIVVSLIAITFCWGALFAQTKPTIVGSVESTANPAVRLEVTEMKRIEGGFLSVRFQIVNASNTECCQNALTSNVYLVDNINKKKYLPVHDSQGACLCGGGLSTMSSLGPGRTISMWVRFAAPPENVQKIAIAFPFFPPSDSMPISQ